MLPNVLHEISVWRPHAPFFSLSYEIYLSFPFHEIYLSCPFHEIYDVQQKLAIITGVA